MEDHHLSVATRVCLRITRALWAVTCRRNVDITCHWCTEKSRVLLHPYTVRQQN